MSESTQARPVARPRLDDEVARHILDRPRGTEADLTRLDVALLRD